MQLCRPKFVGVRYIVAAKVRLDFRSMKLMIYVVLTNLFLYLSPSWLAQCLPKNHLSLPDFNMVVCHLGYVV